MMKTLPYAEICHSPNHGGPLHAPEFLVIHYTAGASYDSAKAWLCSEKAKASAHVLIGRNGEVAQLVPFDVVAWHAGQSEWRGKTGLNKFSIGIELDAAGPVKLRDDGQFQAVSTGKIVNATDVFHGKHKNGGAYEYWTKYPYMQILQLKAVVADILREFPSIREIVGHDDICDPKGRKSDPGPALAEHWPAILALLGADKHPSSV